MSKLPRVARAAVLILVAAAALSGCAPDRGPFPTADPTTPPPPVVTPTPTPTPTPTFDTTAFSIDDPASLWVVVNKLRPLDPQDYAAPDLVDVPVPYIYAPKLRAEASDAVVTMFADFTAETGLKMQSQSAYRSYGAQVSVYNGWVAKLGQAGADLTSARPGHSEHQTGLSIDISAQPAKCALSACFGDTPQGIWLAENAYKYGFILRYPNGLTSITGYEYEPWHYRYTGVLLSTEMHNTGTATLEEFFDLPAAPTYG
ncbi:D-alanyl-D-alanine carboxypeptidase family protein [Glaciihabitans arcticus]|uniref:D-alanyl-D-alanine carboxypeptidase family protein n=1 Tax=Glaciihabitans arcticus TaxID=2668039 RepID=A0A4Q9GU66_9MICO|nr:M15 family metallopeptidase [Glaciihabitans arcticus]TBN58281.1 D-alanyl-D-alanine carboxypeptidase family protein [Glaciihabitans arcticus]